MGYKVALSKVVSKHKWVLWREKTRCFLLIGIHFVNTLVIKNEKIFGFYEKRGMVLDKEL